MAQTLDDAAKTPPLGQIALRRIVGAFSVMCVGVGGAIGSGIFATPGEAALQVASPWLILALWAVGGFITLLQSMVTAELATRFPRAGGEYQYLKEAYGEFAAFFFGWSFTVFIVGAGAGSIAAAFGDFTAELFDIDYGRGPSLLGCGAIVVTATINCLGLRTGAVTQNVFTLLKVLVLFAIAVGAMVVAGRATPMSSAVAAAAAPLSTETIFLAFLPVFWSYTGATDSAKLAEETREARRSMPLALLSGTAVLTAVYCLYNYALFCGASPTEMAGRRSVPALIFDKVKGYPVGDLTLVASGLICLGSLSAMFMVNTRVMFAMARDGLAFRRLAWMSRGQAPVWSIVVGATIACVFVANRKFGDILRIYFLASAVIFGLSYFSLIVFRRRERLAGTAKPSDVYRIPAGELIVAILIMFELAIAGSVVTSHFRSRSWDSLYTLGLLAGLALFYRVWRVIYPR